MRCVWLGLVLCGALLSSLSVSAQIDMLPSAVWADGQIVTLWRGDGMTVTASAGAEVLDVALSDDGRMAAFISGTEGLADVLSVALPDGNVRTLVQSVQVDGAYFGAFGWYGSGTLYFNTVELVPMFGTAPNNDLWHVDVASGVVERVLESGIGGAFAISPTGETLAIVYAGAFDENGAVTAEGAVRLVDLFGEGVETLLTFTPVSTASPVYFYPSVDWLPDGSAIRVAIPPPDLLYNGGQTVLWELAAGREPVQLGAVDASLYGQPRWSADGSAMVYQQGDGQTFTLHVADAAGNPLIVGDPVGGALARWSDSGAMFAAVIDSAPHMLDVFVVGQSEPMRRYDMGGPVFDMRWMGDALLVAAANGDSVGVFAVSLDGETLRMGDSSRLPLLDGGRTAP